MSTPYDDFPDLEVVALRKQIKELESKLTQAQAVLRENDLLDAKSHISPEESIIVSQIGKLKELDDKNIPFQIEDVKVLEILVKCLIAVRAKSPIVDDKKKKKEEKVDVAKLLKFVEESK